MGELVKFRSKTDLEKLRLSIISQEIALGRTKGKDWFLDIEDLHSFNELKRKTVSKLIARGFQEGLAPYWKLCLG